MMKFTVRISVLVLISLISVVCRAERVSKEHYFHGMSQPSELVFSDTNHKAWTKLLSYTCTGDAVFGLNASNKICLRMAATNSQYNTTRVDDLGGFLITHTPTGEHRNVKVYVSKDSIAWKEATGDSIQYRATGAIDVQLPRGNYYLQVKNTNGSYPIYIGTITYYIENCPNCFAYEPE